MRIQLEVLETTIVLSRKTTGRISYARHDSLAKTPLGSDWDAAVAKLDVYLKELGLELDSTSAFLLATCTAFCQACCGEGVGEVISQITLWPQGLLPKKPITLTLTMIQ